MPVADDHVLRNQIHRRVRVVAARLPFAQAGELAIEQAVAPQPQLPFGWLQVIANGADFVGEEFRLVAALAARALVFADVEHFIHPGMKRIGLKGVADLIHQRKHDFMHLGMTRAIALAVELVGIGPGVFLGKLHLGSLVELRVDAEAICRSWIAMIGGPAN